MNRLLLTLSLAAAVGGIGCQTSGAAAATSTAPRIGANEPWRQDQPQPGTAAEMRLPNMQRIELKNGLTVILVEDHSLPVVHVNVAIRAGSAADGKDAGLAALAYDAAVEAGAGGMAADAVSNAFADIGTELNSGAGVESGSLSTRVVKRHLDKALELASLVLQKPAFNNDDVERLRGLHLAEAQARAGDPDAVVAEVAADKLYGADHPYGHRNGSIASIEKLTTAKVKKFWSDAVGGRSTALVLVGDVTLDEAKQLAEKHFGKLKQGKAVGKAPAAPKVRTARKIYLIDTGPGPTQAVISVVRPLVAVKDPDEASLIAVNQIVGGMFTSRLNLKLREEKGWSYGAGSYLQPRTGVGTWTLATNVETVHAAEAVHEVIGQLDTLKSGGVTEDELAMAKANYVQSLPGVLGMPPVQVNSASSLFALGLPMDYHASLVTQLKAVTIAQANAAAVRAVNLDDFIIIVAGHRADLEAQLKAQGDGELTVLNADGTAAK
jgi:zinc protease